jgi:hypothetical protein
MNKIQLLLLVIALIISSCKKDKPMPCSTSKYVKGKGLFILNEGTFNYGNASVSYLNLENNTIENDIYSISNNLPLGDVAQSMFLLGDKIYIAINNSQKVEVVNANNFKNDKTISGFTSPRYFQIINSDKFYVSDLYSNRIEVLNSTSTVISNHILTNCWTEKMILVNDKVYVTCPKKKFLLVINSLTDLIEDSIAVNYGANSIQLDKTGNLWIYCTGSSSPASNASVQCINVNSKQVIKTIDLGSYNLLSGNLTINQNADSLYFINHDLYKFSINDNDINSSFINSNSRVFYGLHILNNGKIIITDAKDYTQSGELLIYNNSGVMEASYSAGIIPSAILEY